MTATTPTTRHLPLLGTYNVRDIGGYETADGRTTRWRVLLRSDSLHRLDAAAQKELLDWGVRTVIDLRHSGELEAAPNVFASGDQVRYLNLPLISTPSRADAPAPSARLFDLEAVYRRYIDERQAELCSVLAALAEPDSFPAIVHCTAGKDRTGLVVALLLSLAGVSAETIAADYALSASYLQDEYFEDARGRAMAAGVKWEDYQRLLVCPPEYMLGTLTYVQTRHGDTRSYLRSIGLTEAQLDALRTALVE